MCGIAGIMTLAPGGGPAEVETLGARMGRSLAHRGPDSSGLWSDPAAGIALAHRRLAIQDLSQAGHQPMASACGRFVICYNGEVYNGPELLHTLAAGGLSPRGHSDTEAMVEGIARWGLEPTLDRLVGMFAFALWDREARELTLVRDRFGIKPLYWGLDRDRLLFGSELKAVLAAMKAAPALSREGLAAYLEAGFVPAPLTIHQGIHKLRPGHLLRVRAGGPPQEIAWWRLGDMLGRALDGPRVTDPAEARALIEDRLGEAVRMRLLSDRPVGALLSGGIDSSLVTALMQEGAGAPVRTYSIGSPDRSYDEAAHARQIARYLGTEHTELTLTEADCLAVVPDLTWIYDEPFGDSSAVPTVAISRLARAHVTVALSGDGGDEVFCGYNRYLWNARTAGTRRLPGPLRRGLAAATGALPPALLDLAGRLAGQSGAARRAHKLAAMLSAEGWRQRHRGATLQWPEFAAPEPAAADGGAADRAGLAEEERLQVLDLTAYLPDDILTKVDRASMSCALEVRVPLLDHRVVEAAFTLAPELKLRGRTTKWLMREMLAARVPRPLFERPKQGFAIPVETWLRRELRDWAEALITGTDWEGRLGLSPQPIRAAWQGHLRGAPGQTDRLWTVLMLASWAAGGTLAKCSAFPVTAAE